MMGLFVWGRLRYDLVAALSLLAAVVAGIVPAEEAFKGFSDDIVIIVGAPSWSAPPSPARASSTSRCACRAACALAARADAAAGHRRDGALGLRQEHRRARDDDPGRVPVRAPLGRLAVALPDADGVRVAPRRHRSRSSAPRPTSSSPASAQELVGEPFHDVRLHAGRPRHRGRRRRVPDLRLSPPAATGRARSDSTRRSTSHDYMTEAKVPQDSPMVGRPSPTCASSARTRSPSSASSATTTAAPGRCRTSRAGRTIPSCSRARRSAGAPRRPCRAEADARATARSRSARRPTRSA